MSGTEFNAVGTNWTDLPLHQVLFEWIVKNIGTPNDMSLIVAYIGLTLIAWYSFIWVTRFIMSIIWPLFLIGLAIVAYRILQFHEPEDVADMVFKSITIVADTVILTLNTLLQFILKIFE